MPARWEGDDLILRIQVQPRARRDEVAGLHGDRLKVRLAAPPVDGRANAALLTLFAEFFGVPKKRVILLAGESGRSKRVRIVKPGRIPDLPGMPARSKLI